MKIYNIEAVNMGKDQQEIAECVMEHLADREFKTEQEFSSMEGFLVEMACHALEWNSVPQTGGLIVEWEK